MSTSGGEACLGALGAWVNYPSHPPALQGSVTSFAMLVNPTYPAMHRAASISVIPCTALLVHAWEREPCLFGIQVVAALV